MKLVEPYLFFEGRCEEALEFYRAELGAEVTYMMRFKESPDRSGTPPDSDEKIMHANFRVGGTGLMASDGRCSGGSPQQFQGFALSITANDNAEAESLFAKLSKGGQVQMPMAETFFTSRFGMVADRFGVSWMIIVQPQT